MPFRSLLVLAISGSVLGFGQSLKAVQSSNQKPVSHVPTAVIGQQPKSRLPAGQRISLAVGLPLRDPQGLSNFLRDLYDPSSPSFHQFLTPDQFTDRFGPTENDYQTVINFFQTNGFKISATHPNRLVLDVSGSVGEIERTFKVNMNVYQHPNESRTFYSPNQELTLDVRLPILHMQGLDNFVIPHPLSRIESPSERTAHPLTGTGPSGSYMGADFRTAYAPGIPASYNGAGQFVGLLQFDGYSADDITAYEALAGLPNVPLINVLLDDIPGTPGAQNNIEVCLDIEMCVSMAPGLSGIIVYEGGVGNDILNRMATDNLTRQMSSSWSFGIDSTTEQIFQEFAAQGQSYFNASGDTNAFSGVIPTPSDDPFVTSVGGTTLTTGGGAAYSSEQVWKRNNSVGTGGGISTTYAIPTWQQTVSMAANQGSTTMRNIPDVAMVADNVLVIYDSLGNPTNNFVGGTSVSSPLWAGFMALINQQGTLRGRPPVGFLNPTIYALGKSTNYAAAMNDITTGNNTSSSSPTRFFAASGFDLCTGWGTPKGTNLIEALVPRVSGPLVTNISAALVLEFCTPTNGVIDSGETVTVNFTLQNVGGANTTNLIATLLATGGVLLPSAPQTIGALLSGGAGVTLPFTFTAGSVCGSTLTASFQLQDGTANLGTLAFAFPIGTAIKPLTQDFDAVSVPALPAGWSSTISGAASNWVTSAVTPFTGPNAAFIAEAPNPGVAELTSPSVAVTTATARLSFRNFYDSECDPVVLTNAYDGGVLEIKIGTGAFTDILAAGGSFASGGYTRKIDPTDDNPLTNRFCWSGLSANFIHTVVNLPASAAGQNVRFKWRFGTDTANAYGRGGWYIDAIALLDGSTCCTLSPPAIVGQPSTQTTFPGTNVTFSVTASGTALAYQWKFSGTNLPGATSSTLGLTNVQLSQAGPYFVTITNAGGTTNSSVALLRLLVSPGLNLGRANVTTTNVSFPVTSVTGLNYTLQYKNTLTDPNWTTIPPTVAGNGSTITLKDPNPPLQPERFYRVNVN
jgi:hypothetical protein